MKQAPTLTHPARQNKNDAKLYNMLDDLQHNVRRIIAEKQDFLKSFSFEKQTQKQKENAYLP